MARKNKNKPEVVSVTPEGKLVMSGMFKLCDTYGIPYDVMLEQCIQNNMIPSWLHFYDDAVAAGWKEDTIYNRLETAIVDVWV